MPLEVLVIVSPRRGKEERAGKVLTSIIEKIRAEEHDTLKYHAYRCKGEEEGTINYIVIGTFKDEAAFEKRRELQHHQDLARYIKEEDLLSKPLQYMKLEHYGGFDR